MNNPSKVKTSAVKLRAAERRIQALKLRLQGKTFQEIGEEMGVTKQTAYGYVKKAYELMLREEIELATEVRELMKGRLDALLAAHWQSATSGKDKAAAELVLKIVDRMAKLYGADAPEKRLNANMELGTQSNEELAAQARMMGVDISDLESLNEDETGDLSIDLGDSPSGSGDDGGPEGELDGE